MMQMSLRRVNLNEGQQGVLCSILATIFFIIFKLLTIKDFIKSHGLHNILHKIIHVKTFIFLEEIRLFLGTKCQQASFQQTMKSV